MKPRHWIIIVATALFILAGLLPPWRVAEKTTTGHITTMRVEYSTLNLPPTHAVEYATAEIASDILAIEWLCISAAALAVHFCLARPAHLPPRTPHPALN